MAGIKHSVTKTTGQRGYAFEWNADHVFTGNSDMKQYQFLNQVIENRVDFPAGPVEGQVIYRSDENKFYVWNGTEWATFVSPATIVVAADGSGHTTDIQTGINMLPAGGGVVYIKEGTYTILSKIIINKNSVSIKGAGHSTIITNGAATENIIEISAGIDYFTLEGVYITPAVPLGGTGAVISFLGATTRSRVSGCWFENWEPRGIVFLSAGEGLIIENCVMESVTGGGPNYAFLINASSYVTFRGNLIYGGTNCYGIQIYVGTSQQNFIIGNIIGNCVAGISVIGIAGTTNQTIISNNEILASGYGIWIYESNSNTIIGNQINFGTEGIFTEANSNENTITGNMISNFTIGVDIDGATEDDNLITSNMLKGNTLAIFNGGTNTEIAHNKT